MNIKSIQRHREIILYGISMAVLLFLLRWLEWKFIVADHALEVYIGAVALLFTALGIWLALKMAKPKVQTVIVEKEIYVDRGVPFALNEKELDKLGLSKRELEVLQLMAEGLSNQEIAGRLFLSLNTIKTHSSNLFIKLDVSRRTQAVDKARKLGIVP